MHTRAPRRRKPVRAHFVARTFYHAHVRKRVVHRCVCTDLYKTFCGSSLVSYELKFQISWRSELWLRRYLQNNNDVCLTFLRTLTTKRARTNFSSYGAFEWKLFENDFVSFIVNHPVAYLEEAEKFVVVVGVGWGGVVVQISFRVQLKSSWTIV